MKIVKLFYEFRKMPNTHHRTIGMRFRPSYRSGESENTANVRITYIDHGGSWV